MSSKYIGSCQWKVPNKISRWFIWWREASDSSSLPLPTSADLMDNWPQIMLSQSNLKCFSQGIKNITTTPLRNDENQTVTIILSSPRQEHWKDENQYCPGRETCCFFKQVRGKCQNRQILPGVYVSGLHMTVQTRSATLQGNVTKPKDLRQSIW